MAERWKKHINNLQCVEAVTRGRHATRGRKYFGRDTDAAHMGYVGTVIMPIREQTFEEFCEAQRIRWARRLFHETDEERERLAGVRNTDALLPQDFIVDIKGRM